MNWELLCQKCDAILGQIQEPIEIVSGGARGADMMGENYGALRGYPVKIFPANWDEHGKGAGILRNAQMALYADALIAFWDGESKGTYNMIWQAEAKGLKVRVIRY
jgi:hypothetical protein